MKRANNAGVPTGATPPYPCRGSSKVGPVDATPRLENGRRTSCEKGVSKNIRVHAFGDYCPVVVFRVIAVPENNL